MKRTVVLFFVLFFFVKIISAQSFTISGFVSDSLSGVKILYATIYEKNSKRSCQTNNFGFYSLTLPKQDTSIIVISYLGYEELIEKNSINSNIQKNFQLIQSSQQIEAVTVTAKNLTQTQTGQLNLSSKQVSKIPSLGGEKDLFKAFQLMPGVMQGNEGKSGLYVRGGGADQNLIILDDVALYSIEHFTGYFSVFNDEAINNVKLLKSGFPASYGGRLSSVMDVRMNDGSMKKYSGSVSLGVMTARFNFDGPIIKDKMSFMVAARRSMLDLVMTPYLLFQAEFLSSYSFYDINSKINYKISDKDNIYLSFYYGDDKLTSYMYDKKQDGTTYLDINKMSGGNILTAFRWNHVYNNKLFGNLTASYTKFRYFNSSEGQTFRKNVLESNNFNSINSKINDLDFKYDFEISLSNFYKIVLGANYTYHFFKPAEIVFREYEKAINLDNDTTVLSSTFYSNEMNFYIENQIKISRFLNANIGFRENIYFVNQSKFYSHQPRISVNALITKNISLRASYAKMNQNIHLMTISNDFFSTLWVPATQNCLPEQATHYAFAIESVIFKNYDFSIELYYKEMTNLVEFSRGSFWNNAADWEQKAEKNGIGKSYGIEFFINKKYGKLTGWVGYSYSKTTRQFENVNFGKVYPYDFDRPHDFKIFVNYQITKNLDFSASWIFQTGRPINLALGHYYSISSYSLDFDTGLPKFEEYYQELFAERNSVRMKPFHRLDISLNYTIKKKRGVGTWSFGIYNVYNRQNPMYYYFNEETLTDGTKVRKLYQLTYFPIIPSVSYTFKF